MNGDGTVTDKKGSIWTAVELMAELQNMASAFSDAGSEEDREAAVERFEDAFEYNDWVKEYFDGE